MEPLIFPSALSLWVFCTSASVIITVIALYFYKAFAYLIYLAYCSINDLVTVSLKVLHYKLEIKKKSVAFLKSLNWFILKEKMSI